MGLISDHLHSRMKNSDNDRRWVRWKFSHYKQQKQFFARVQDYSNLDDQLAIVDYTL